MTTPTTAAILVIGNEILSGKTDDANVQFLGRELARMGIVLAEARVIRDDRDMIIRSVRQYSEQYDFVFTTGGIGPTHDDITAEAIAAAFDTSLYLHPEAAELIGGDRDHPRMKMAMIPKGASLIENSVSKAPGFRLGNVFVLAGVPRIAQAMFAALQPQLPSGPEILQRSVDVFVRESDIATRLTGIAASYPDIEIGSYPFRDANGNAGANLVARGTDGARVDAVIEEIVREMTALGGNPMLRS